MKLRIFFGLVVTGIAAWSIWLFMSNFQYVYHDEPQPPRGQALYDPLYAASLALHGYGVNAIVKPYLDFSRLAAGDTLVYYGDPRTLSLTQAAQLYTWVYSRGGHLVVQLPDDDQARDIPLLNYFGLQTVHDSGCLRLALEDDQAHTVYSCGANAVHGNAGDFSYAAGLDGKMHYVQQDKGAGWIAVLTSLDFMTNDGLKDRDAQALMLRVLQPQPGHGRVWLIYSVDSEGFLTLLIRYGWMVLLPLGLCILALLIRAMPRFGPPLPAQSAPRRALMEHVRAASEMLWRDGKARILYEAVRADMFLTLRRRHPGASRGDARELLDAITDITGLPRLRVRQALGQDGAVITEAFTDRIATLIEIRKRL